MVDSKVELVKLEKIPIHFQLGETLIDGAVIRPLMFKSFADFIAEAQAMEVPKTFDGRLRRVRMAKQISYYVNGTVIPVGMEDVLKMSIPDVCKLSNRLDSTGGKVGKIVRARFE